MDWSRIDSDPTAPAVRAMIQRRLRETCRGTVENRDRLVEAFVRGYDVLDVGAACHGIAQVEGPHWLHGKIRRWSRRVVGVDLLAEVVDELNRRGFDLRAVDATSATDLGERFDRVVLGEIIEHVDDPVALFRFAARHLRPGGRVLVSSPNPFYFGWLYESFREGVFVPNAEHVRWVGPAMVLEIGRRAGLELDAWWCLSVEQAAMGPVLRSLMRVASRFPRVQELVTGACIYELRVPAARSQGT